jgi:hypothetical protein
MLIGNFRGRSSITIQSFSGLCDTISNETDLSFTFPGYEVEFGLEWHSFFCTQNTNTLHAEENVFLNQAAS